MIKTLLILLFFLVAFISPANNLAAQSDFSAKHYSYPYQEGELEGQLGEEQVVIELFSTQACLFCPVADQFIADVKRKTDLIVLACHVDYFDVRQGSISTSECSDQQRKYVRNIRGATLYTPQVIVNGRDDYIGYEFEHYMEHVIEHSQNKALETIEIYKAEERDNNITRFEMDLKPFSLANGQEAKDLDVFLYLVKPEINITIAEGVNKGQVLPYVGIVHNSEKITRWDGSPQKVGFDVEIADDYAEVVVLMKNQRGHILAANKIKI